MLKVKKYITSLNLKQFKQEHIQINFMHNRVLRCFHRYFILRSFQRMVTIQFEFKTNEFKRRWIYSELEVDVKKVTGNFSIKQSFYSMLPYKDTGR